MTPLAKDSDGTGCGRDDVLPRSGAGGQAQIENQLQGRRSDGIALNDPRILVDLSAQRLSISGGSMPAASYVVSTAAQGPGERSGSGCTPRGLHRVRVKIGAGCAPGTVFRGRRWTGELYSDELARRYPDRDWVLTRILWLTGLEPGRNRGGDVDTLRRFIYIHGCPPCEPMGEPRSHGCIRMRDADLIALFDHTPVGTLVEIR